jgi:ribosome-binding factor A
MSRRIERLNSTIRQELAQLILREIDDPRIKMMPGITRVETADDLSVADVFVSIMGTPGQQTAALNALKHSAGMLRTRLSKMLTIRQMPFLRFQIDEGQRKEIEMLELLHKLQVEREAKEQVHNGGTEPRSEDENEAQNEAQNEDKKDHESQG